MILISTDTLNKCVKIRRYPVPYFFTFGLNTEIYSVSLCIQSECGKTRIRITPNEENFYAVTIPIQLQLILNIALN